MKRDLALDVAVLQLLESATPATAVPVLLTQLNDTSAGIRETAFASLQTVVMPLTQETFNYEPDVAEKDRVRPIQSWNEWWTGRRAAVLRQEVPTTLKDLESQETMKRLEADWSLQLISGENQGFEAADTPQRRAAAVERWKKWWESADRQLGGR